MNDKKQNKSKYSLMIKSIILILLGITGFGSLLFISAGTFRYWNTWLFLAAFFIPDILLIIYLFFKDPELLRKRLNSDEKEKVQALVSLLYRLTGVLVMLLSGLNYRFGWSEVPIPAVIGAAVIMVLGFSLSGVVMRQNRFASRTIEIQNGQKVIDTGLYSVIRHPMYLSGLLLYCPMPLVLGSVYVFILTLIITPFLMAIRILNEEKVLKEQLAGYEEYMQKVPYRMIPFIW
ncbi:MAG: isoprenylcysteine carboxylmethyltransferase family protein [Spirochaetaceae bacterium]|nr:isoprenylcysteine carboxylmethyltransferase family protein [Spirochaetaceae bacterium]